MHCFIHSGTEAVAVCKTCNRGVCTHCAREAEFFITCSDACESEAAATHKMNRMAHRIYGIGVNKKRVPMAAVTWVGFGVLFLGWAAFLYFSKGRMDWFLIGFGSFAFVLAWMGYRRAKEMGLNC